MAKIAVIIVNITLIAGIVSHLRESRMSKKAKFLEIHEATIQNLSHDGRGVAECNKKTTFIFGALPGETVKFKFTNFKSKYNDGQAIEIANPSPDRVDPKCSAFGVCGGCAMQHLNPEKQVEHKQAVFLERLKHQAHVQPKILLEPITDTIWGYRHKARLSVRYVAKKGKVIVGFRERNSNYVADISHCDVLAPVIGEKILAISQCLLDLEAKADIAQIEVAITETQTALIVRNMITLSENDLTKLDDFAKRWQFHLYLQPKGIDSIYLRFPKNTDPLLHYQLVDHDLTMYFHPFQFTQVNPAINLKMIARALQLLDLNSNDRVLDLFCGIGNFTLPMAKIAAHVVGVEGDKTAVERAKDNAERNKITNTEFYVSNLFEECQDLSWAKQSFNKILLDPPRSGAKEVLPLIKKWRPSHIVYVSCDTATLARDVHILLEYGYQLTQAGIMDMFPHTAHVEAIALLTR